MQNPPYLKWFGHVTDVVQPARYSLRGKLLGSDWMVLSVQQGHGLNDYLSWFEKHSIA